MCLAAQVSLPRLALPSTVLRRCVCLRALRVRVCVRACMRVRSVCVCAAARLAAARLAAARPAGAFARE